MIRCEEYEAQGHVPLRENRLREAIRLIESRRRDCFHVSFTFLVSIISLKLDEIDCFNCKWREFLPIEWIFLDEKK
jgi:hypothetical protein